MHVHYWLLTSYEPDVSRGECRCGAVKYFADYITRNVIDRVNKLNKTHSKEGETMDKTEQKQDKRAQKRRDYDKNKEEIIADYRALGEGQMLKKWGIRHSTWLNRSKRGWTGLAVRWGLVEQEPPETSADPNEVVRVTADCSNIPLPAKMEQHRREDRRAVTTKAVTPEPLLPAFNDNWTEAVQLEWLRVYKELKLGTT